VIEFLTKIFEALKPLFDRKPDDSPPAIEPTPTPAPALKAAPLPPSEPKGLRLNFYPKAIQSKHHMKTRGKYAKGYPLGAVVHFSAGRDGAENLIKFGAENGFAFLAIQKDGAIYQSPSHPISSWGYHAGESKWKTLFGAVSDDLIGIEITCAGRLEERGGKLYSWFGREVLRGDARWTDGKENQQRGWYEKFTPAQEKTLIEFLFWLKRQAPEVFSFDHVLGHDEVSGKAGLGYWRKNDPGAALSMTMRELREKLKADYKG
jgi:N-acetyl-anhydromuramyl-L-alanine amidase AmpD